MSEQKLAFLLERKRAYQQGCGSETTNLMMRDLAWFCRAERTCFDPDARKHALAEGRREVWLRIQDHLNLTPEQLLQLYDGPQGEENA